MIRNLLHVMIIISQFFNVFCKLKTIFIRFSMALCLVAAPVLAEPMTVSTKGQPPAAGDRMPWPVAASLSDPTDRYPHNVLGRIPAFTTLTVTAQLCSGCAVDKAAATLTLAPPLVFEDVAPRLWDITGDGRPEVVVVQSHERLGARLTVWELRDKADAPLFHMLAATPFIGTRFRWLAPFGHGDVTGDGNIEIAYVETPHLGKTLRLVGLEGAQLVERAALRGVTNHRIGEENIAGTLRMCDDRPEAVLASADWQRIVGVRWQDGALVARDLGPLAGGQDWEDFQTCPE